MSGVAQKLVFPRSDPPPSLGNLLDDSGTFPRILLPSWVHPAEPRRDESLGVHVPVFLEMRLQQGLLVTLEKLSACSVWHRREVYRRVNPSKKRLLSPSPERGESMNTGTKTRFEELVETVGDLEVTVLASSKYPEDIERHLDLEELRAVVFNLRSGDRAHEHVKRCRICEGMVRSERQDNPLIEEDDGDPS